MTNRIDAIKAINLKAYTDQELLYLSNFERKEPILATYVEAKRSLDQIRRSPWEVKVSVYEALKALKRISNTNLWAIEPVLIEKAKLERLAAVKELVARRDALILELAEVRRQIKTVNF